jgi:agmatinase
MDLQGLRPWGGLAVDAGPAQVLLTGIPYDGSAVYRRGAAQAPEAMRRLSAAMPPLTEAGRSLSALRVRDIGDMDLGPDVEAGWPAVADRLAGLEAGAILTVLGGDHCSSIPVLAAQHRRHPDLAVVWVDAHPDLCDVSRGGRWTCGCALRRAMEVAGLGPRDVVLAGCRDFDPEEVALINAEGITMVGIAEAARDPAAAGRRLAEAVTGRPLHISCDIDVLDPAFAPGTEVPSAGGLTTRQTLDLLGALVSGRRLVGVDVAEVAPPLDPSDITVLAGLKLIFELWGHAC